MFMIFYIVFNIKAHQRSSNDLQKYCQIEVDDIFK